MINVISKLAKYLIPAGIVSLIPFAAFASGNLEANDFVGMSFWIISIGMVAATVFFFMESMKVDAKWRTSLVVAGLVTMIAAGLSALVGWMTLTGSILAMYKLKGGISVFGKWLKTPTWGPSWLNMVKIILVIAAFVLIYLSIDEPTNKQYIYSLIGISCVLGIILVLPIGGADMPVVVSLLNSLSGIPYMYGMSVILAVCVIYTMRGGLFAVIGTDFIQSLIILIGIVVVGFAVLSNVSIDDIHTNLLLYKPALLDVMFPAAIMAVFNNLLFGLGEVFHNNVWWSRAFAFREGIGKKAFFISGLIWLPIPIAAGFIALASGALGVAVPNPDMVGPLVVANILGEVGAIAIFIIVFCSLASSIDSLLAATSDLIAEDVYRKLFRPKANAQQLKKAAQIITLLLGLGTWAICLPRIGTLATVLFFAGPMVGSMIWPIVTGLYWKRASSHGAISGMLLGSAVGLLTYFEIGWYVASLVGTAVSMACVLFCAYCYPAKYNWNNLREEGL